MQRTTIAVLLLTAAALIGAQWSGVHAHVDSHGFEGTVQSAHGHHHDKGDDKGAGHDGDIDVQVVDFGTNAAKAVFLLLAVGLTLFLLPRSRRHLPFEYATPSPVRRRLRWRPPLRAPPPSISIA